MIRIKHKGNFKKTEALLASASEGIPEDKLKEIGDETIKELQKVTPVRTGLTRASWYYEIKMTKNGASIIFANSNVQPNGNVALLLDVGHATKSGVWIEGLNYIDPVVQPIFEKAKEEIWKEMTNR